MNALLARIGGRSGLGPLPQLEHVLAIALVAELLVIARGGHDDARAVRHVAPAGSKQAKG